MAVRGAGPKNDELEAFAAAVAHELRTPLAALSGEVELALRRDRTAAVYRDALARISASVAELVELTGDLAFLGQTSNARDTRHSRARLRTILARVAERMRATRRDHVSIEPPHTETSVSGDELRLGRALVLIVEHALRYRSEGTPVSLRVAPERDDDARGSVSLVVDAAPGAFPAHAWTYLIAGPVDRHAGPLRLRTAERIVHDCGGSLHVETQGSPAVYIRLRRAEDP